MPSSRPTVTIRPVSGACVAKPGREENPRVRWAAGRQLPNQLPLARKVVWLLQTRTCSFKCRVPDCTSREMDGHDDEHYAEVISLPARNLWPKSRPPGGRFGAVQGLHGLRLKASFHDSAYGTLLRGVAPRSQAWRRCCRLARSARETQILSVECK